MPLLVPTGVGSIFRLFSGEMKLAARRRERPEQLGLGPPGASRRPGWRRQAAPALPHWGALQGPPQPRGSPCTPASTCTRALVLQARDLPLTWALHCSLGLSEQRTCGGLAASATQTRAPICSGLPGVPSLVLAWLAMVQPALLRAGCTPWPRSTNAKCAGPRPATGVPLGRRWKLVGLLLTPPSRHTSTQCQGCPDASSGHPGAPRLTKQAAE